MDYRQFLRELIEWRKREDPGFSSRELARNSGVAQGYLSMVLSGKRALSEKGLSRIAPTLGLSEGESSHLLELVRLGESREARVRQDAVARIHRSSRFARARPEEARVCAYLSNWICVAVREMAATAGFVGDARWIQARLRAKAAIREIQAALDFLVEERFILKDPATGRWRPGEFQLNCDGTIFDAALSRFHGIMLDHARRAIGEALGTERHILGHTFAIPSAAYTEVVSILSGAHEALKKLEASFAPSELEEVYHVTLAAFPLSRGAKSGKCP